MKITKYRELSTNQKLTVLEKFYKEANNNVGYEDTLEHIPGTGGVIYLTKFEQVIRSLSYKDPTEFELELFDNLYVALDLNDLMFIKDLWEYHLRETANEVKKSEEAKKEEELKNFFEDAKNNQTDVLDSPAADGHK